ncbi:MAG: fumarylacetoacetate hydrolase family protein, partial [Bradyrhizobium sp.]|nr:fumarylacetoacetate hydrolase family protein [Bradyrhizobium sp.]
MSNYAIVTYSLRETGSEPRAGLLCNGDVIDVANGLGQPGYASVAGLLGAWDETEPLLDKLAADVAAPRVPVSGVHVLAPVPAPLAIYCIGANYRDHVDNMARARGLPPEPDPRVLGMPPWFFLKSGHCVVGPDADVAMSGDKLDWEPELVAVIGRKARNVSAEAALGCVAGYTIANDLSARDRIFRKNGNPQSPFFFDFVAQKSFDGACPLGP